MRSNEEINYWLEIARDDLRVAGRLIDSNDRLHALFFCHLGIEKMLKALYVKMNSTSPPPIHNLVRLAMESKLTLSGEDLEFLNELLRFNIEARYPKDRIKMRKTCTKKYSMEILQKVKKWRRRLIAEIRKQGTR
jgi:HEPN domain-containing protein